MENKESTAFMSGRYVISADARCIPTNYSNDQIWELNVNTGEPPALAIQTTYGLRARMMRIYPRFVEGDNAISEPNNFDQKPTLIKYFPNYISTNFAPLKGIDVICEYWIPSSNQLTGRIHVTNTRLTQRNIVVELAALLSPSGDGQPMGYKEVNSTVILIGKTSLIYPVIYVTGSPVGSAGPYPALSVEMDLAPGSVRHISWVHTAENNADVSLQNSRKTADVNLDAEIARLTVINERMLDISTGNSSWDEVLRLTQINALRLMVGPTEYLPNPSFVLSRQPDHGFSYNSSGTDYGHLWNGQTPLEADFLSSILLPISPDLVVGIIDNFISTISDLGVIDHKPGLAGQRAKMLATPILTNLAWKIFQFTNDEELLSKQYPFLKDFILAWFDENQDKDMDGLPEWKNVNQSGYEDNPLFSLWEPWSTGSDITKIENPALCAMLYNEIRLLIKIAEIIGKPDQIPTLQTHAQTLLNAIGESWNETISIYQNWDRDTHNSQNSEKIDKVVGPGKFKIIHKFPVPVRINIHAQLNTKFKREMKIVIHGKDARGDQLVEPVHADQFSWNITSEKAIATSEGLYQSIELIEALDVGTEDQINLQTMGTSSLDQTLMLPLWAGIPSNKRAEDLINKTICNEEKFWQPHGIPASIVDIDSGDHPCSSVHIIWNNLIGEGLLRYGYRKETAELVTKLMNTIAKNLRNNKSLANYYQSNTGKSIGEPNSLGGLAPIHLFMESLGIRIISPNKVMLIGNNPFPQPITVQYRGLIIDREVNKTKITFPGGQSAIVQSNEPRIISLDSDHEK